MRKFPEVREAAPLTRMASDLKHRWALGRQEGPGLPVKKARVALAPSSAIPGIYSPVSPVCIEFRPLLPP